MPEFVTLATPIAGRVLCWSAETIAIGSALAALVAIVSRLGRRRLALGPAARHALWLAVLIKLMAPPIVHWPWSVRVAAASAPVEERREIPAAEKDIPVEVDSVSDVEAIDLPREDARDPVPVRWPAPADVARGLAPWAVSAWLVGSIVLATGQARRILRFCRRLREASPAPAWLVEEAERVGRRLGVRVPAIRVLAGVGTPMLWCLGRPVLLVPEDLLESLDRGRWPAILAHELAHLRRLDPWVRRLEWVAGLVWWWNPLFWLTRRRLDFEAELACDAWVLWALPDDRLAYAESLLEIGSAPSRVRARGATPMPALGIAGAAQSFERRLTMILRDPVVCRTPASGLLAAALLTLLALPSWTFAEPNLPARGPFPIPIAALDDLDATPAVDDDDDKDDDAKLAKKAEEKAKAAAEKDKATADKAKATADKAKAASEKIKASRDKAQAVYEKVAPKAKGNKDENTVEVEVRRRVERSLGPDFEKRMEALGKEMESKFGPGSDFEKRMKSMGKEMEAKYGPGSDFEKEMKAMAERMAKEFGPGSKFAEDLKAQEKKAAKARAEVEAKIKEARAQTDRTVTRARSETAATRKARRVEAIEAQIKRLSEELKRLKAEGDEDDEG
jgi:beta-lactamase regulating signal transducer with metallopeptidase domain